MKSVKCLATLALPLVAAVALFAPSMAGASQLYFAAGKLAPVGTVLSVNGGGALNSTWLGVLPCETIALSEQLTRNDGVAVEGVSAAPGAGSCSNGGRPIELSNVGWTNFRTTESGTGTVSIAFDLRVVKPEESLVCHFAGTGVPFTYTSGSNSISFWQASGNGIQGTKGCGMVTLSGSFALAIGSAPVILK